MAKHVTLCLSVSCRRWLRLYLYTVVWFAAATGLEPSSAALDRWIRRGLKMRVVSSATLVA